MAGLKAAEKCLCLGSPSNAISVIGFDRGDVELECLPPEVQTVPIQFPLLVGKNGCQMLLTAG